MSGLGLTQMNSMLALQSTMKTMTTLSASRTSLNGNMSVLKSEIKIDKSRGMDTARKEEEYADMENNLNTLMEKMTASAAKANDIIIDNNEEIRDEEYEENKDATNTWKLAEENTDTVDISMFARNKADYAPQAVPEIPLKPEMQKGVIVDVHA